MSMHHLSETTGIPERALDQLMVGDPANLPAAPYIHGYLVKIGELLDFDGDAWWQQLKHAQPPMSSGTADLLPRNRFSRNRIPSWALWGVPIALALLTYGGFRFASIIGLPDIAITQPDRDGVVLSETPTHLIGTATPGSRVTINGEAVPLTTEGQWDKEVTLQPGAPNDFTVEVTKFLGRSRSASRRIFYEAPIITTSTTSTVGTTTTPELNVTSTPKPTVIKF